MSERKGILIVDDTLAALKMLAETLIRYGYVVRPAGSGDQALAAVNAELPELILLDIRMPDMDGFEVCRRLKAQNASREIPILFLSASSDLDERIKGFEAGAVDFISKPFQNEELLARVRTHLELSRLQTKLEAIVMQRTEELSAANERLHVELIERKRVEIVLRVSEEKFRWVIENSSDVLFCRNYKTDLYDYISPVVEKISGFSHDEMSRMTFTEASARLHPDDQKSVEETIASVVASGGGSLYLEYRFKHKDGRYVWISENGTVFCNGGVLSHGIGSARDITNQKNAEIGLGREKKITDALLESVPGLLYMYNEEGFLVKWNRKHESITGYSASELPRLHFLDWFEGADREKASEGLSKMFQNGYADFEVNLKIKDGSSIPFLLTAVPLEIDNRKFFVGIGIDVAEIKKAQEQIRLSLNEKEVLLRELYHRTRNNMQVICSMLKLHSYYTSDEKILHAYREMETRIHTMALVHQMLFQSQNLSSIDFDDYIRELCDIMMKSYRVSENKITFTLNISSISVLIDIATPCGMILNELISNSLKYAFPDDAKGEIRITLRRDEDGSIELDYRDNGVGVPAGFDFSRDGKMGMQTVMAIAQHQLQGTVDFESLNGIGCRIRFRDKQYSCRI